MPKKNTKPDIETKIATAALRLAARQGWARLTLEDITRAAKISPAPAKKHFAGKNDILPAIVRFVDAETAASVGKPDLKVPPRDRLFEVMMARMDVLQEHRRAILSIMEEVRRNPSLFRRLLPAEAEAVRNMLKLAGLGSKGPREIFTVAGLLGIYGLTLCRWSGDSSSDMAKTMAVLDRSLRRVDPIVEILFRVLP